MRQFENLLLIAVIWCGAKSAPAQAWTQTSAPTTNYWNTVACSADGSKIVATFNYTPNGQGGYANIEGIYTSTNSGNSWIKSSSTSNGWSSIASSADGSKWVAIGEDLLDSGHLVYTSTNSAIAWTLTSTPSNLITVASSANGTNLAAIGGDGFSTNFIYVSTNSGVSWAQTRAPATNWSAIASSADGTKLVAVVNAANVGAGIGGPVFTSTNSGTTWAQAVAVTGASGWSEVASSADGTKLAAVDYNHIFVSTNSGVNWAQTMAPFASWGSIASSADGSKLIASTFFNAPYLIYTSTNSGASWTSNNIPNQQHYVVACSADGNAMVASSRSNIYTARITPLPRLALSLSAGKVMTSWIVPSTNFVMQQSVDLKSWANMTNQPVLNFTNLQNEVVLPPPSSNVFYRLKTP